MSLLATEERKNGAAIAGRSGTGSPAVRGGARADLGGAGGRAVRGTARTGENHDPDGDGAAAQEGLPDAQQRRTAVSLFAARAARRGAPGAGARVRREDTGRLALAVHGLPGRGEGRLTRRAGGAAAARGAAGGEAEGGGT